MSSASVVGRCGALLGVLGLCGGGSWLGTFAVSTGITSSSPPDSNPLSSEWCASMLSPSDVRFGRMPANISSTICAASSFWRFAGGLSSSSSPLAADAVARLTNSFADADSENSSFSFFALARRFGCDSRDFPSLTLFAFSRLMNAPAIFCSCFLVFSVSCYFFQLKKLIMFCEHGVGFIHKNKRIGDEDVGNRVGVGVGEGVGVGVGQGVGEEVGDEDVGY